MPKISDIDKALARIVRDSEIAPEALCYYCGCPADSVDHVVSRMMLDMIESSEDELLKRRLSNKLPIKTVPSCRECNSIIGDRYFDTLLKRKLFVKRALRTKYRRFINTPLWSDEELSELSDDLRNLVLRSTDVKYWVLRRLKW